MQAAFDRLRRHARSNTMLLGDVARRVVTDRTFARDLLEAAVR